MATGKKGNTTRKKTATKTQSTENRQLQAVLLFAVAIFMLCLVFIKGENIWTHLHHFIFGIFGVTAYFYPFLLGAVAILVAVNKAVGRIWTKVTESVVLVMMISACVDLFTLGGRFDTCGEHLSAAYCYEENFGGGFFGALFGHPLYRAFGKTGAVITVILLIFVLLMLVTGTTLIALFKAIFLPAKQIAAQAENAYAARGEAAQESAQKGNLRVIKGHNIDFPVDDIPEQRLQKNPVDLDEKQRKVIAAYYEENAEDMPENSAKKTKRAKSGAAEQAEMDSALQAAKAESHAREVPFDAAAEEAAFAKQAAGSIVVEDEESYHFPPISLLNRGKNVDGKMMMRDLDETGAHLVETLRSFGVETRIVDISRGPTVTRFELQPCAGVKISKITNLADDIALNLATAGVRIEAPIPNKAAVGIEVPNKTGATVGVREIIESDAFVASKSKLTIALGRDIAGNAVVGDIAKMPHGLIAGATGSGKSVCINSIIMSILYKAKPDEVKLLMIDPKVVELVVYNGIPHLLVPVVTEPRKAAGALGWAVSEMERRYKMFADRGVRDISGYNKLVENLKDEPAVEKMPQIVIIIDELADLMMTAPNEVEDSINRIAAKARAAGMHLLIATQRPSVDVVTGVIKANIPSRIALAVSSQIDSRTILDSAGAEKLLGHGDMLYHPAGSSKPARVQGCFVSDEEIEAVVDFIKHGDSAEYSDVIMDEIERNAVLDKKQKSVIGEEDDSGDDPVLEDAMRVVVEAGQASTSLLQRKLKLGYARAARVVDQLEAHGIVGPFEGSKPRKVLISKEQLLERQAGEE